LEVDNDSHQVIQCIADKIRCHKPLPLWEPFARAIETAAGDKLIAVENRSHKKPLPLWEPFVRAIETCAGAKLVAVENRSHKKNPAPAGALLKGDQSRANPGRYRRREAQARWRC
jgi:hypothetical protein